MGRAVVVAVVLAVVLGPFGLLVGVALLAGPALAARCGSTAGVGRVPSSLAAATTDGAVVTLGRTQLERAATIIRVGLATRGVGVPGVRVALMAALTESGLRQLANPTAVPSSADYPNDGDGADHDSLGLFQMRPSTGWGTVGQLMDATYQARAFYGGSTGPNSPSPAGLLDVPGWRDLEAGQAAQAVEVSAFPERYQAEEPVADAILHTLTAHPIGTATTPCGAASAS